MCVCVCVADRTLCDLLSQEEIIGIEECMKNYLSHPLCDPPGNSSAMQTHPMGDILEQ